ncbi:hypothetical protein EYF80_029207 [Liparis tanakae]|uniref:Uncharacterized protein n=1 Tax=Liparis tanakae TaxID=230148 RepID=A0A4Z2H477_9TELE|nr:hypothetical protein EYF80_029207 [Liparis tanakae]
MVSGPCGGRSITGSAGKGSNGGEDDSSVAARSLNFLPVLSFDGRPRIRYGKALTALQCPKESEALKNATPMQRVVRRVS